MNEDRTIFVTKAGGSLSPTRKGMDVLSTNLSQSQTTIAGLYRNETRSSGVDSAQLLEV